MVICSIGTFLEQMFCGTTDIAPMFIGSYNIIILWIVVKIINNNDNNSKIIILIINNLQFDNIII